MSGVIHYKLDGFTNDGLNANNNQAWFISLYKYFQLQIAAGAAQLVASNHGLSGSGFDYWDGANPAGENAFFVIRMLASASTIRTNDFYLMFQWADGQTFGAAPGNPGLMNGTNTDGVGVVMCYRLDGGDPWNGTTNANGLDSKGTPVWVDGGSQLVMFTSRNETGSTSTDKQDLEQIADFTGSHRAHIWGDADAVCMYGDAADDGTASTWFYAGAYEPLTGLTIADPLIQMHFDGASMPGTTSVFDVTAGYDGQMIGGDPTGGSQDYVVSSTIQGAQTLVQHQPSSHGGTPVYMEVPMYVTPWSGPNSGVAGNLIRQLVGLIYNVPNNSTNAAISRAYLPGAATQNFHKWSAAWAGGLPPQSGGGKDGVEV